MASNISLWTQDLTDTAYLHMQFFAHLNLFARAISCARDVGTNEGTQVDFQKLLSDKGKVRPKNELN